MTGKSTTLAVRVPHDLHDRLVEMAAADKRTLSQFCMLVLKGYVAGVNHPRPRPSTEEPGSP